MHTQLNHGVIAIVYYTVTQLNAPIMQQRDFLKTQGNAKMNRMPNPLLLLRYIPTFHTTPHIITILFYLVLGKYIVIFNLHLFTRAL